DRRANVAPGVACGSRQTLAYSAPPGSWCRTTPHGGAAPSPENAGERVQTPSPREGAPPAGPAHAGAPIAVTSPTAPRQAPPPPRPGGRPPPAATPAGAVE